MDEAVGETVLKLSVAAAEEAWGSRLQAVYALGSLAHGGFAAAVSDVDVGVILHDPLVEQDARTADEVTALVGGSGTPVADRLSLFWGSRISLAQGGVPGRFPSLDRLDLLLHGRLLHGSEARHGLPTPTKRQLVIEAAHFLLGLIGRYRVESWLRDPSGLLAEGPRQATKTILFPVRFLYTGRTGEIGRNRDATEHLAKGYPGPAADLAIAAMGWRDNGLNDVDPEFVRLVQDGLGPLYVSCLREHARWMEDYGEVELARELRRVQGTLS